MNIVVLCGGISTEREISLRTSAKVSKALRSKGHRVLMIDLFFGTEKPLSFEERQDYDALAQSLREKTKLITEDRIRETGLTGPHVMDICRKCDIVFIGLHGINGEDGKIQAVFEAEHIPYTGSDSQSSAVAMSKAATKEKIAPYIRMPEGTVHIKGESSDHRLKAPCVLKPSNGGSSLGVIRVMKDDQYESALQECFQFDDTVVAEQFVAGRELTQGVLDGEALPPVEICPENNEWYDYTNKYNGITREVCPADIPEDVLKEMSEKSIRFGQILGLSVYYRIDYLLDENGVLYALEANSLPGMTDTSLVPQEAAAVGISYPDLCQKIIDISLRK